MENLNKLKKDELRQICSENNLPLEEWDNLTVKELIDYIMGQISLQNEEEKEIEMYDEDDDYDEFLFNEDDFDVDKIDDYEVEEDIDWDDDYEVKIKEKVILPKTKKLSMSKKFFTKYKK